MALEHWAHTWLSPAVGKGQEQPPGPPLFFLLLLLLSWGGWECMRVGWDTWECTLPTDTMP